MKVGIAGAGLVGRLLAWALIPMGWEVTLFDQDDERGQQSCAYAAAGMLSPIAEMENSDHRLYELGLYSLRRWPEIIAALPEAVYFQQQGSLMVAHRQEINELKHYAQLLERRLPSPDLPYSLLSSSDILQLEPELTRSLFALYFAREGQLDNQTLLQALGTALHTHHVHWHPLKKIVHVTAGKIMLENATFSFDVAVDCRGLGAKSHFPLLRGVRGELLWLHAPAVSIHRPIRLWHPRYRLYIVPRPHHHYLIGASEIESEDMTPISVRSTLELLSAAYSVHPGFAEARVIRSVVHCRPTLPDHLPKIKYADGLIAINGLYRHGFLIAPALIDAVLSWLHDRYQPLAHSFLWEPLYA